MDLSSFKNSLFKNFFKKPIKSVVGIDIGSAFIKVVQLKKERGKIILDTYGTIKVEERPITEGRTEQKGNLAGSQNTNSQPPSTQQKVEKQESNQSEKQEKNVQNTKIVQSRALVEKIFEEAKVTASHSVISIPSKESLVFMLKLPELSGKDLDEAVNNEARRHIPMPINEVSLDWWLIPTPEQVKETKQGTIEGKGGTSNVLVAAVRNDFLTNYQNLLSSKNTTDSPVLELDIFGAIRSSLKYELAPSVVLDFGASGVRFAVVEYGVMKKFHSINRGAANLTKTLQMALNVSDEEAEELKRKIGLKPQEGDNNSQEIANTLRSNLGFFFSELRNFLMNFERTEQRPIRKIVLIGGGSMLKGLRGEIESDFSIETVFAEPFSRAEAPDFLEDVLEESGPEFAISLGLALRLLE